MRSGEWGVNSRLFTPHSSLLTPYSLNGVSYDPSYPRCPPRRRPGVRQAARLLRPGRDDQDYLLATKANDVEAAKKCWTIDDNNESGALDVVVGLWISSRKLVAATEEKLGPDGVKVLGRWNRPHGTNGAIDTTLQRLGTVRIRERGDEATLKIEWQPGDGDTTSAFLCVKSPLVFRRVAGEWKLDANIFTATEKAADLFAAGKIWPVWRDEIAVMADLIRMLEAGDIKDVPTFEAVLKGRVEGLRTKYAKLAAARLGFPPAEPEPPAPPAGADYGRVSRTEPRHAHLVDR